ncbi:hypothetical protein [Flavobacterium sp.]|uniref:hypothetical protein n=1 Tax=Flavobacterium sp. TaxID=239 RepID=UPI00375266E5
MNYLKISFSIFAFFYFQINFAQTDSTSVEESNIQNYTPSKLLEKGKWDVKWFNNLYSENKFESNGSITGKPRENYFSSSVEIFTGITNNKKINIGFIIDYRSNTFGDQRTISVFNFENKIGKSRSGFAHFAPSVKVSPFNSLPNFSIQTSLYIPLFKEESNINGYLAEKSYIFQNRFFYDYTFSGNKFQLFSELNSRLFFGEKGKGYANNSLELTPGLFLSYFATNKFTILGFVQQELLIDLGNKYSKNYTALGFGSKYQITKTINIEALYSKFVRGNDTGLGQSFNFGLRAIF